MVGPARDEERNGRWGYWHQEIRNRRPRDRRITWLLLVIKIRRQRQPFQFLRVALPTAQAIGPLGPIRFLFDRDSNLLVLLQRQWLYRAEQAVLDDGFDGDRHAFASGVHSTMSYRMLRRSLALHFLIVT